MNTKNTNIFDVKNYNTVLSEKTDNVLMKFKELINEYLFHITENIIIQTDSYFQIFMFR